MIDEFITSLWYTSITPDQEVPEELRMFLNGVIAEVASRGKQVNLMTLLSQYNSVNHVVYCTINLSF